MLGDSVRFLLLLPLLCFGQLRSFTFPDGVVIHQRLVSLYNRWTSETELTVVAKTNRYYTTYDSLTDSFRQDSVWLFLEISRWPDGPWHMADMSSYTASGEKAVLKARRLKRNTNYWYRVVATARNGHGREWIDSAGVDVVRMGHTKAKEIEAWEKEVEMLNGRR